MERGEKEQITPGKNRVAVTKVIFLKPKIKIFWYVTA
jgi:hypothetical protein